MNLILVFTVGIYWFKITEAQTSVTNGNKTSLRLPQSLRPIHYKVKLRPFLEGNFTIEGNVEITFEVLNDTNEVILHMKQIITKNETLQIIPDGDTSSLSIYNQTYDRHRDFYIATVGSLMEAGKRYVLKLEFTGTLSGDLEGFYKTSYFDSHRGKVWVAATQFQATSARRAFPCFDEPHLKATFDVSLGRRENMTALSNMPLRKTVAAEPGWVYDDFETSVPMSTYLLAFVICDFKYLKIDSHRLKTDIKLWTRESLIEKAKFGKQITIEGLIYLEEFFNLSFPLPKLDLVALPEMSPNAMENWGLILSRESGLLHVPGEGTIDHERWVAYLISHELAHQWFGNIVTMKWWTDLWLNEGFATYIGYRVVDHIKPDWKILDLFVVATMQKVMKLDALRTAPPVRITVEDPQEIREVFGEIAYSKGGSIIRMMNYFLGEKTFRAGLSTYLDELKYKSSEQEDLWNFLTAAAHRDGSLPKDVTVNSIMDTWTTQPGFPVISVDRKKDHITLRQTPFVLTQSNEMNDTDKMWYVPISWTTEENPEFENITNKAWLRKEERELTLQADSVASLDKWIFFNPKQTGYYRVNYDPHTWQQLIKQLQENHTVIHVVSRAQLLDDALNLARTGHLDYDTAMSVTSYLQQEKEYLPWAAAFSSFEYLDLMLRSTSLYGAFKKYALSVISPLYELLHIEDNRLNLISDKFLQQNMVMWACHFGHEGCISLATTLIENWRKNPDNDTIILGDFTSTFLCTAIKEGDKENLWDFLWRRYLVEQRSEQRQAFLKALGCSSEVWILNRYLEASFKPEWGIRRQDASTVYKMVAGGPIGSLLAWNHLKENWIKVKEYIGTSMFALPDVVKLLTSHFNTIQYRDEMIWFKNKYAGQFESAGWAIEQAVESTEANIAWIKTNLGTIDSWLKNRNFTSSLEVRA